MIGLIIVGSSLRHFSQTLLENYISYFEREGFYFSPIEVLNFESFFKESISSCELDYFLKESHSDGDERNVFRFDIVNKVLKGVRSIGEGKEEIVYLVYPKPFHFRIRQTALFSNLDLANLIKNRKNKGCGEITYFNTSCWSDVKARYEIEAANSDIFLNIPSTSSSDTFLDQPDGAIRGLIDSYRKGLNFKGFRETLKKNKGYASRTFNQYLFPDESRYTAEIFKHISIPLKIEIHLERQQMGNQWESLNPDEAL